MRLLTFAKESLDGSADIGAVAMFISDAKTSLFPFK
jgi:hypothetical protein